MKNYFLAFSAAVLSSSRAASSPGIKMQSDDCTLSATLSAALQTASTLLSASFRCSQSSSSCSLKSLFCVTQWCLTYVSDMSALIHCIWARCELTCWTSESACSLSAWSRWLRSPNAARSPLKPWTWCLRASFSHARLPPLRWSSATYSRTFKGIWDQSTPELVG